MKKTDEFDLFANADDEFIEKLSCGINPLSKREKDRIFRMSERKCNRGKSVFNINAGKYKMHMKYRPALALTACLVYMTGFLVWLAVKSGRNDMDLSKAGFCVQSVESVLSEYMDDFILCKEKIYENLELSECRIRVPDFESCSELEVTDISTDTAEKDHTELFKKYCSYFLDFYNPDNIHDTYKNETPDKNTSEKQRTLIYEDAYDGEYMEWDFEKCFPKVISKGVIRGICEKDSELYEWYTDKTKQDRYFLDEENKDKLFSEYIGLSDAYNFVKEDYINRFGMYADNYEMYSFDIKDVSFKKIQGDETVLQRGEYVYSLGFTLMYEGIPFDTVSDENSKMYGISAYATVPEFNEPDILEGLYFPKTQKVGEEIKEICSLEKAIDILSEYMTKTSLFEVKTAEFVYSGEKNETGQSVTLRPTWKFTLFNSVSDKSYIVYIDAVNAECRCIAS